MCRSASEHAPQIMPCVPTLLTVRFGDLFRSVVFTQLMASANSLRGGSRFAGQAALARDEITDQPSQ
jgi:hypothetical protein